MGTGTPQEALILRIPQSKKPGQLTGLFQ